MSEDSKAPTEVKPAEPSLEVLLQDYWKIEDAKKRGEFFRANPRLKQAIDAANHHV